MKKYYRIVLSSVLTASLVLSAAGCGGGTGAEKAQKEEAAVSAEETAQEEAGAEEAQDSKEQEAGGNAADDAIAKELAEKKGQAAEEKPDVFKEMSGWEFIFASGVGAWETSLQVAQDGTFSGEFHDADMGDTGAGYEENGTLYLSEFTGKFGTPEEVEPFIYEVPVEEIKYKRDVDTEEIFDGTRYVYSGAYGLFGADKVKIYLPGAPIEKLPEGYMDWVTLLNFQIYTDSQFYTDIPEDLPFCGIYNEPEDCGFFSWQKGDNNRQYVVNQKSLPGLQPETAELHEDGTYHYRDTDPYGMYSVTSDCFRLPADVNTENPEDLARACIEMTENGEDMHDFYVITEDVTGRTKELLYLNGKPTIYAFWSTGSNEDTRDCDARVMVDQDYAYVYTISCDADDEMINGEVIHFYLGSLELSGNPEKLSSAGANGVERKILVYARPDEKEDCLQADEVVWVSGGDEEMLALYGIDPDDVTNDYAIAEDDGDFMTYKVLDDIPIYIQYPPADELHSLVTFKELRDYMGDERLLNLFLDENENVCLIYEPYTP